jgi:flagellar biosynthesis/type III secretory pathway protein FliH
MIQYDDDCKPLRSKGKEEGMEEGREAKRNGWCRAHCLVVMCNVTMTIHFLPFPIIMR